MFTVALVIFVVRTAVHILPLFSSSSQSPPWIQLRVILLTYFIQKKKTRRPSCHSNTSSSAYELLSETIADVRPGAVQHMTVDYGHDDEVLSRLAGCRITRMILASIYMSRLHLSCYTGFYDSKVNTQSKGSLWSYDLSARYHLKPHFDWWLWFVSLWQYHWRYLRCIWLQHVHLCAFNSTQSELIHRWKHERVHCNFNKRAGGKSAIFVTIIQPRNPPTRLPTSRGTCTAHKSN